MTFTLPWHTQPEDFLVLLTGVWFLQICISLLSGRLTGHGDPPVLIGLFSNMAELLAGRLNRPWRSRRDRFFRGLIWMLIVLAAAFVIAWVAELLVQRTALAGLVYGFLLLGIMGSAVAVGGSARAGGARSDAEARRRAEDLILSFQNWGMAGLFWFWTLGAAGVMLVMAAGALRGQAGPAEAGYGFGSAARLLIRIVDFPAALLAGILMVLASVMTPKTRAARALKAFLAPHTTLSLGKQKLGLSRIWSLAVGTSALGITLGGPGGRTGQAWLGPRGGHARLAPSDLKKLRYLMFMAHVWALLLMLLAIIGTGDVPDFLN